MTFSKALQHVAEQAAGRRYRFLVVNEHYLGHVTVHRLFCEALARDPQVEFEAGRDTVELDSVDNFLERLQRYFAGLRFGTSWIRRQGLDLGRWRFQRFVALLARKRVERKLLQAKREGRPYDAIAFHTQTAAFACLDLMSEVPTLVSTDITAALAAREWNVPLTRWTYWPGMRMEREVFSRAAGVALFSEWARQSVLAENPALRQDPGKVRHLPPGVNLAPFLEMPLAREHAGKVRLLFVGGDFERKGGPDLIAAWKGALRDSCELHIVSNGVPVGLDNQEGLHVYRNLKPYSPELLTLYAEADVFVLPTRNEAYGHVFIEAMAAGLPVVATAINAIPEILPEEASCCLVRPSEPDVLVRAIRGLCEDVSLRRELGRLGRERVIRHFDAEACFGRYVGWLKEMADLRAR